MPIVKFTEPYLRHLTVKKRTEIYDSVTEGLTIRVTPKGSKTFTYRIKSNGKVKRITLGTFPALTLADARKKVQLLKATKINGNDPYKSVAQRKAEAKKADELEKKTKKQTFNALVELFRESHLPKLRPRSQKEYNRIIDAYLLPAFDGKEIKEFAHQEIRLQIWAMLNEINKRAPIMANRTKAVLSSIFGFSVDIGLMLVNPVIGMKKPAKEKAKDRFFTDSEVKALWNAFDEQAEPVRSLLKMLLLLGQRKTETCSIQWKHVNFEESTLTIPASNTKADREHTIPLPSMALDILLELRPLTGHQEFVFPSPTKDNAPLYWLGKAKERIREITGIEDFTFHDLRRTVTTNLADLGTDRTTLGKLLNHKQLSQDFGVTARYDKHGYTSEMRTALQLWTNRLNEILTGETYLANVIQMR